MRRTTLCSQVAVEHLYGLLSCVETIIQDVWEALDLNLIGCPLVIHSWYSTIANYIPLHDVSDKDGVS